MYPNFRKDFCLETDASVKGLGAIMSQIGEDGRRHPVAYASRALSDAEKRYAITKLETLAVVWAMTHFHHYLYGHNVVVFTDHSAVKAVLTNPGSNGKHTCWWTKVYGTGAKKVEIVYQAGKDNLHADALPWQPNLPAPVEGVAQEEVQVCAVNSTQPERDDTIGALLQADPEQGMNSSSFAEEQRKDDSICLLVEYLEARVLPEDSQLTRKMVSQAPSFILVDRILYFIDVKQNKLLYLNT